MKELRQTLRSTFRRVLRLENRRVAVRRGRLDSFEFTSALLGNTRQITIYLPAGYDERDEQRYPVFYMQDGQNLFEPHRSFIPGQHWRLGEAADAAIGERTAVPMIIIGIDNTGPSRVDEYTPTRDVKRNAGGRADDYFRMLQEELRPLIDQRYRTKTGVADTAVGGSSLGGLLALHLGLMQPPAFGRVASMSPSVWWDGRAILDEIDSFSGDRPRLWLDIGGREGREALIDARELRARLVAKGWGEDRLHFHEDRRGDHSERAWAGRARMMLEFLFPPD